MYDVLLTPDPEEVQPDMKSTKRKQRNLVELLNTKYDEFNYSNWAAEFNVTVSKVHCLSERSCLGVKNATIRSRDSRALRLL